MNKDEVEAKIVSLGATIEGRNVEFEGKHYEYHVSFDAGSQRDDVLKEFGAFKNARGYDYEQSRPVVYFSMPKLAKEKRAIVDGLRPKIKALKQQLESAKAELNEHITDIVVEELEVNKDNVCISKGWECKDSPTLKCIYDNSTEAGYDECLYCGHPEERN